MTVSPTLMQAILAMDSYNRGYNEGIAGLGGVGSQIGNAVISQQSNVLEGSDEIEAGFYAVAYNYDGGTVISYRGTDNLNIFFGFNDIWNGWGVGAVNGSREIKQTINS